MGGSLHNWMAHDSPVIRLFPTSNRRLLSVSADRSALLWDVTSSTAVGAGSSGCGGSAARHPRFHRPCRPCRTASRLAVLGRTHTVASALVPPLGPRRAAGLPTDELSTAGVVPTATHGADGHVTAAILAATRKHTSGAGTTTVAGGVGIRTDHTVLSLATGVRAAITTPLTYATPARRGVVVNGIPAPPPFPPFATSSHLGNLGSVGPERGDGAVAGPSGDGVVAGGAQFAGAPAASASGGGGAAGAAGGAGGGNGGGGSASTGGASGTSSDRAAIERDGASAAWLVAPPQPPLVGRIVGLPGTAAGAVVLWQCQDLCQE